MFCLSRSGLSLYLATVMSLGWAQVLTADTIVKLNLGATGPDIVLTTVDGKQYLETNGPQETAITFHEFVSGEEGIADIVSGQFTLTGVSVVAAETLDHLKLVTASTQGGSFELRDGDGALLLTGDLGAGALTGTSGNSATGAFLTAELGTFTGPTDGALDKLFRLLDPSSASLSISLTDVKSGPDGTVGFVVSNGNLADFAADATANIGASRASAETLPEPSGMGLALVAMTLLMGWRQRRD